jgi:para-aminobenzoate synthetase component 1
MADFNPTLPLVEELRTAWQPWEVCRRFTHLPYLLFLDSASPHPSLGRYSFVMADPFMSLRARGDHVWIDGAGPLRANPWSVLAARHRHFHTETIVELPPFQGGVAGLFGYGLCHHLERLPRPKFDEFHLPDLVVGFYDWVIGFDHVQKRAWLISTGLPEPDTSRRQRAEERLQAVHKCLRATPPVVTSRSTARPTVPLAVAHPVPGFRGLSSNFDRPDYLTAVQRAIDYVHAGDCFQVNLSQRLISPDTRPPLELYRRLRERNPASFAGYFDMGDFVLASASPERFLRVQHNQVETRPIKGTRPRGATPDEDRCQAEELLRSLKDRAENVMIIDLLRNDLGRVCAYGSVKVAAVCRLESYPTVHHLVSEVRGRLQSGRTPLDLLRAAFPGGSVTGVPKVRAMEIIAELEPTVRGPYCGSLGYLGFDGTMDTSILIRTCTVGGGWVQLPVGGGIVADSTPEGEYAETLHKAEGVLRALR